MTDFKPRFSGAGSDYSTKYPTSTVPKIEDNFIRQLKFSLLKGGLMESQIKPTTSQFLSCSYFE